MENKTVEDALEETGRLDVAYKAELGYPVRIDADDSKQVADNEVLYEASHLEL